MVFHSRPVHSLRLSSHRFLCLPLRLPPWTVPCRIVLASPDDRVTCPYRVISLKSGGLHTSRWHFQFWLSLPHWLCDLYTRYREVCENISSLMPVSFFQCLLLWSTFHMQTKIWTWPGTHLSLILELMGMFQMFFSLITAAVVWVILDSTSGLDPSSDTIPPRY